MIMSVRGALGIAAIAAMTVASACTGGRESSAAEEQLPRKNPIVTTSTAPPAAKTPEASTTEAHDQIKEISPAIPIYAGAQFREDLTRRDEVMIRNQYGPQASVYTLATEDSYPQVYHYYTTYLAQFRAYAPSAPLPPGQQNWRTLEIQLNQAMQDPFIPGDLIKKDGKQVLLQIAETEAEPKTVIRYVITPGPANAATLVAAAK